MIVADFYFYADLPALLPTLPQVGRRSVSIFLFFDRLADFSGQKKPAVTAGDNVQA
ncbi:hypothetical protein [Sedimenticola thiotaurini]|uniref:hypothetical protein n=1 Tax=Sedimenticola thiotaurini TaxID=1543721 RepID=UPI0019012BB7|nr:hypothetical protein [Sedimenticola thiotaurini]